MFNKPIGDKPIGLTRGNKRSLIKRAISIGFEGNNGALLLLLLWQHQWMLQQCCKRQLCVLQWNCERCSVGAEGFVLGD